MVIRKSAIAPEYVGRLRKGERVKETKSTRFDELLKIGIYRDITRRIYDRRLISLREYERISRRIDEMEDELIKPQEAKQHARKTNALKPPLAL